MITTCSGAFVLEGMFLVLLWPFGEKKAAAEKEIEKKNETGGGCLGDQVVQAKLISGQEHDGLVEC